MSPSIATFAIASLAAVAGVQATIGSGNYGTTYSATYDVKAYANTAEFCSAWHAACVGYVGPLGDHHRLTCDSSLKGPTIPLYCGGIVKNAAGGWSSKEVPTDYTLIAAKSESVAVTFASTKKAASPKKPTKKASSKVSEGEKKPATHKAGKKGAEKKKPAKKVEKKVEGKKEAHKPKKVVKKPKKASAHKAHN